MDIFKDSRLIITKKGLAIFLVLCTLVTIFLGRLKMAEPRYIPIQQERLPETQETLVPALLDLSEETMMLREFNSSGTETRLSHDQRQRLHEHIKNTISNDIHYILWFNGPDYFDLNHVNTQLKTCMYSNCVSTSDKSVIKKSSAILFCTTCEEMGHGPPFKPDERPAKQIWAILTTEPPHNHLYQDDFRHHLWKDSINWSMTYRKDSDIFMPYGYLETRSRVPERNYSEIFRQKTKFAAWIVSHCGASSMRDSFVRQLQGYGLPIDIYGKCGVPVNGDPMKMVNDTYKFYLSLENAYCNDYVTEKFFAHFSLDTIVITRGGAEYGKLLPNDSFIDAGHFKGTKELVDFLLLVNSSEELYTDYLRKKDRFIVHTYDYRLGFCDLCYKLNNKDKFTKTYHDIVDFIYTNQCHIANDVTNTWVLCIILFTAFFLYSVYITFHNFKCNGSHDVPIPNL